MGLQSRQGTHSSGLQSPLFAVVPEQEQEMF